MEDSTSSGLVQPNNTNRCNGCKLQWKPTSSKKAEDAESNMLKGIECSYERFFVDISNSNKINTIKVGNHDDTVITPLVLLHGFCAGAAFYISSFKDLSEKRNVYSIDLLGFGRSSRTPFSTDHKEIEETFINSIEEWREKLDLKQMILIGHSFGGYLACSYAISYPYHIEHLVLADPWGFPLAPQPGEEVFDIPAWKIAIIKKISSYNPLGFMRALGPLGPSLVRKVRGDIQRKYQHIFGEGDNTVSDYIYHCNAQQPSGEEAFTNISEFIAYSKNPLISRMKHLHPDIPLTLLYGENSWMLSLFDFDSIRDEIPNQCYFEMHQIDKAGHHIFADNPKQFNQFVNLACDTKRGIDAQARMYNGKQFNGASSIQMVTAI